MARSTTPRPRVVIAGVLVAAAVATLGSACDAASPADPEPGGLEALRQAALEAGLAALPESPIYPVDNPYVAARVELGRLLFFDPILSGPRDVACSTCHLPRLAFADGRAVSAGAGATGLGPDRTDPGPPPLRLMPRNSPTVLNVGFHGRLGPEPSLNGTMFWGGGAFGLEDQVLNPIAADTELRGTTYPRTVALDSVLVRLRGVPGYVDRFADAYPGRVAAHGRDPARLVTATTLERALAAYLRELGTPDAPLDRFLRGDTTALGPAQAAGLRLFVGRARCVACHSGPQLSDFRMHVTGTRQAGVGRDTTPGDDLGWGEHGGVPYAFRTPPLRQVALTAPYFHAGTAETLADVLAFKAAGRSEHDRVSDAALDPLFGPLDLTAAERADLEAFLTALTDDVTPRGPLFAAPEAVPSGLEVPR